MSAPGDAADSAGALAPPRRAPPRRGPVAPLRAWGKRGRQSGRAEFARLLGTSKRWRGEITTDCLGRQTSGFVEGFNTRVQVLKRRCDGICTVGRLVQRLTRDVHGYQRFGPT
jgi:transposase